MASPDLPAILIYGIDTRALLLVHRAMNSIPRFRSTFAFHFIRAYPRVAHGMRKAPFFISHRQSLHLVMSRAIILLVEQFDVPLVTVNDGAEIQNDFALVCSICIDMMTQHRGFPSTSKVLCYKNLAIPTQTSCQS